MLDFICYICHAIIFPPEPVSTTERYTERMALKQLNFFKECRPCGFTWGDLNDFLGDPDIRIVGYQVDYDDLVAGTFLFIHSCGATLHLPVREFYDLHEGPIFKLRATGSDDCPGYCQYQDQLDTCPAHCECAYVRDIIHIIKSWPKY